MTPSGISATMTTAPDTQGGIPQSMMDPTALESLTSTETPTHGHGYEYPGRYGVDLNPKTDSLPLTGTVSMSQLCNYSLA